MAGEGAYGKGMSDSGITAAAQAIGCLFLFCLVACGRAQSNSSAPLQADKPVMLQT